MDDLELTHHRHGQGSVIVRPRLEKKRAWVGFGPTGLAFYSGKDKMNLINKTLVRSISVVIVRPAESTCGRDQIHVHPALPLTALRGRDVFLLSGRVASEDGIIG